MPMLPTHGPRPDLRLEDKYTQTDGWLYMTGTQVLVRLPIQQRLRDEASGRNTGGYISGYRGSPLGRYDMELAAAGEALQRHNVQFRPGLNEDLAATAIWGSQYVGTFPGNSVEGVFGLWYGKGPGVDRSGDVLRHANLAGTSPLGGVVAIAGDDHGAKSSTVANFSDQVFIAVGMPVLYPSNTQELLGYGLHGIAMSRHSGCWVGLKVVTDVVEGGGSVHVGTDWPQITVPDSSPLPGGLSIRRLDGPLAQEDRLYNHKLAAALAYARVNDINQIVSRADGARVGIISAGKAWQDVLQALRNLGIDQAAESGDPGIRLLKIGMIWPLDPSILHEFATGLETIVVVEEKRPVLEEQVRAILYGAQPAPRIVGKRTAATVFEAGGEVAFPNSGELSPDLIASVITHKLDLALPHCAIGVTAKSAAGASGGSTAPMRVPGFCSGCPHNRSTRVVEGSRALAGIGCHAMATLVTPLQTTTMSHMGGEGVMWLGQQRFTSEKHVFANLGDGTFAHSGFLAIRQAVAAHVPITYKLLYNGFVAMTGGQLPEGELTPSQIVHGLAAEGVRKMAVVTDDVSRYVGVRLPDGVRVFPRSEMEALQLEYREYPDVSVILYDQPCATERRRLRKRGKWADPAKRTFINAAVCEGCGDCGQVSNCMSIEPLQTDLGRKRRINQESCNKDFTCTEGFCPSFVTVHGGAPRKAAKPAAARDAPRWMTDVPDPLVPAIDGVFNIIVNGIGGTGIVTIGQTLAVAAHAAGLYSSNLDVTGLSQKYGAVMSHVRLASSADRLHATRIGSREADTLVGCDLIVAAGDESMSKLRPAVSRAVVSADVVVTSDFARNPDWTADPTALRARLEGALGDGVRFVEAQRLARALLGDGVASNMLMLGMAWQLGQIPLPFAAIYRAIELNGVAVEMNLQAFLWGRRAAHDPAAVDRHVADLSTATAMPIQIVRREAEDVDTVIARREQHLVEHSGAKLARRYRALVDRVHVAETHARLDSGLTRAVAESYFKLLAIKDEWEVARLYTDPAFRAALDRDFEGPFRLRFHLGAWPFAKRDERTGQMLKAELGSWVMHAFRLMSRARGLRGTWLDPFRNNPERQLDRELQRQFEGDIDELLAGIDDASAATARKIAELPMKVRGYGHVKKRQADMAQVERDKLLAQWHALTNKPPARGAERAVNG